MAIKSYSKTAANNNTAAPNGFPEGMAPSGVNDAARQVMADIRTQWEDKEWFDYGDVVTYVSASSFTVPGDQTANYLTNRRIRCTDATTLYGKISSSSYASPSTTVNVTLDSGSLSASLASVALGSNPTGSPVDVNGIAGLGIYALLNSPSLVTPSMSSPTMTGTPTAPTAAVGTNTTQVATTAFAQIAGVPPGTIIDFAGTTPPAGYLGCPAIPTNASRTTYANLFAAIGTTWGAGDGLTTFGIPWFPAGYVGVQNQGLGVVGTSTTGSVIAHTHALTDGGQVQSTGAGSAYGSGVTGNNSTTIAATGGAANLPAGQLVLKCVKY